jgi:DNA-binding LacI/PurR family transcriptional regulator
VTETPRRPTIRDVATVAGVSSGTVSRVLNGRNWVSPESKAAVEAAIKKTGYRVNAAARNLAMSRANTMAFLLTETQEVLFEDPNFAALVRGTSAELGRRDISFVLIMAGDDAEQHRALNYIAAGHVDGVLLAFTSAHGNPLVQQLIDSGVPIVSAGQPLGFEGRLGVVAADDLHGAMTMTRYLRSRGHRRIATIAGPRDTPGGRARLEGFRQAQGDDFDADLVRHGDYSKTGGAAAMRSLLADGREIDAVFAANDAMAAGAIEVLVAAGRRVPDDVAVAGFDDSPFAVSSDPAITTMRQPFERISAEMVRVLLEIIDGAGTSTMLLPTELVQRASA